MDRQTDGWTLWEWDGYRTYRTDGISGIGEGLGSRRKAAGRREGQTDRARFTLMSAALLSQSSPGRCLDPLVPVRVAQRWPCTVPDPTGMHRSPGTAMPGWGWVQGVGAPRSARIRPQGLPGYRAASSPSAAPQSWAAADPVPPSLQTPFRCSPASSSMQGVPGTEPVLAPVPGSAPHPAHPLPQPIFQPTASGTGPDPRNISQPLQDRSLHAGAEGGRAE